MQRLVRSLIRRLRRLSADDAGSAVVLMTLGLPVVLGGLGVGVDTGAWYMEKRRVQQIADSAALGGARARAAGQDVTSVKAIATRDAARNGYAAGGGQSIVVNAPPTSGAYAGKTGAVEVIVTRNLPSLFSRILLGSTTRTVSGRSVAYTPYVQTRNLEVAVVLDLSGSMNGNTEVIGVKKLEAQKNAAKALLDIVVGGNQSPYTSRAGIVPFSDSVNVGSAYFHTVTNKTLYSNYSGEPWSGVVERTGSKKFTDDPPNSTNGYFGDFKTKKNTSPYDPYDYYFQNLTSQTPNSTNIIKPLSSDKTALKAMVDGMTATGSTAGHLGLAWAWYMLSPKWNAIFTGTMAPNAYDPAKTYKALVIMSDFDNNSYYEYYNGTANYQFEQLCTQIKNSGVKIYTIGYGVSGSANNTRRINCASSDTATTYTYTTNTVDDMLEAFEAIANSTQAGASDAKLRIVE